MKTENIKLYIALKHIVSYILFFHPYMYALLHHNWLVGILTFIFQVITVVLFEHYIKTHFNH